jgi:hypothetical protein
MEVWNATSVPRNLGCRCEELNLDQKLWAVRAGCRHPKLSALRPSWRLLPEHSVLFSGRRGIHGQLRHCKSHNPCSQLSIRAVSCRSSPVGFSNYPNPESSAARSGAATPRNTTQEKRRGTERPKATSARLGVHKWMPTRWIGRTVLRLPPRRRMASATRPGTRTAAGPPPVSCAADPRSSAKRAAPRTTTAATAASNWACSACDRTSTSAAGRVSRSTDHPASCLLRGTGC